ncbi:MAG: hypothetical protein ACI4WX_02955, partial [Aristaeellaceae bacterium]
LKGDNQMKFAEINAIFTSTVTEYIAKGYAFNTASMSGSQGEIAKVDLRKGNDVVRVYLYTDTSYEPWGDLMILEVGRCTDEQVINATGYNSRATVWNNRLEIMDKRVFWKMSNRRDNDWFIEGDAGKEAILLSENRKYGENGNRKNPKGRDFENAAKIVLPAVKRHIGKNRYSADQIKRVYKYWDNSTNKYQYCADTMTKGTIRFC